jgi:hypothetical protein
MRTKNPFIVMTFILICGCTYGYSHHVDVAYLKSYSYKSHNREVEVFFGSNKPLRAYVEFALIEVKGAQYDGMNALLAQIKTKAQELGADAIININKDFTTREQGSLIDVLADEEPEKYTSSVFTGIAIKYIDTEK